jgi:NADPH:quinone reductase-like Zn-dependent oxidoreductase
LKAIMLREYGAPEVLRYEEIEAPAPGPGELLVKVHAVSVNRSLDLWLRQDGGGYDVTLPIILGIDPSGTVEETGEGVAGFSKGDRVASILPPLRGGAYAEYAVVPAERTYHVPAEVGYPAATAVSRHFPMAYSLCRTGEIAEGDWVLVMGAAGSLGSAAIQVARHHGANVIAAAGSDERVAAAVSLGAQAGVNYRGSDLAAEVARITDGKGVKSVFENIADPTLWPGAFNSLGRQGILVTVGAHGGGEVMLDVKTLYRNGLSIRSGLWNGRPGDADESLALAATGEYRVQIHRVLPLSKAAEAHHIAEDDATLGKVILDPTAG